VGGNKGLFYAILGIQHPAVLYEAKHCCMRNTYRPVCISHAALLTQHTSLLKYCEKA